MPVSPQDFALWSRMTGNPYPQTPAERMALAPHVYEYTRQVGRQGGPTMGPVRRAVDIAGKAAIAAGAIAGAGYLAAKGFQKLDLDDEPSVGSTVSESMPDITSQAAAASKDITPPTTSDYYGQDLVPQQTSAVQFLRGTTAQKPTLGPIEQKPATQSEVIGSQQHFTPGAEEQQLASSAQPSPSVREQAEELIGRVSAAKIAKFRQSPSYAATVKPLESEELVGDDTPFAESAQKPLTIPGPVRITPKTRITTTTVEEESPISTLTDIGSALKSKGIYLSGDPTSGEIKINTEKGGAYHIDHPYASHPKEGIRQTALQEEQQAKELLQAAGVTPEQVKSYWSSKFVNPQESPIAAMSSMASRVPVSTIPSAKQSAAQMEDERLARLAFGNMPLEQATALLASARASKQSPSSVIEAAPAVEVKQKLFQKAAKRPAATTPGTEEHLIAQAREHLEGIKTPIPGSMSHDIGGSSTVKNITLYPGNQVSVTYKSDPETQYAFKSDPRYASELKSMLEGGQFGPGGMHSAGGFIQAGINKKLLY